MMTEPLSGAAYNWTATGAGGTNTLGAGVANISFTTGIPMVDGDQIGLAGSFITTAAQTFLVRLQFSNDNSAWYYEQIESPGAVVAGAQRYTLYIKEWGPITGAAVATPTRVAIERPACFNFFRVGVYGVAAIDPADAVQFSISRQRGGQLQSAGG